MKTQFISLIFLCFCMLPSLTQNMETDNLTRKITLNTGEVFFGEILVENEQIVMIRTADGSRFQFPKGEVKLIEKDFVVTINAFNERRIIPTTTADNDEKFMMIIEVQGGISSAKQAFSQAPIIQGALVLGARNVFFQNTFLGGGISYSMLFPTDYPDKETIDFLPLFLRFQKLIGENQFVPYFEMDVGYGISLNPNFGGGTMLKLSVGMAQKFSARNVFYFGVFAGLQNFSGQLTQTNDFGTFNYYGNSTIQILGVKVALKF